MLMTGVAQAGFRGATDSLKAELQLMPLSRWNESVLRYYFCRGVALAFRDIDQFVECGKIDLVLAQGAERAFVEFKFYWQPRRYHPYGDPQGGFKGGPSLKNLSEFQACVNQLAARQVAPGLSKFVVLVYADRTDAQPGRLTFAKHYDRYSHPSAGVTLRVVDASEPIASAEGLVQARLYELEAAQQGVEADEAR